MPFELIDNTDAFLHLADEWRSLESRSTCHVFQNHTFIASWLGCAAGPERAVLALVVYRENGVLKGAFPACVVTRSKIRFLTWLGGLYLVDYGDILFDPASEIPMERFIDEALTLIRDSASYHVCYFQNVRHDARSYTYFKESLLSYRTDRAPYVQLTGDFTTFEHSLREFRKKLKSDTLRQIKRLTELGALEFVRVPMNDAARETVLQEFFLQKKYQYESTGVRGVLLFPGYEEFYREEARQHDAVHISCLKLNDDFIAIHYGYLYNKRLYYVMPSYSQRYAKYSPGRVLTYYLIQECYAKGVEVFDFCMGDETYKYDWTNDDVQETSFVGNTLIGRMFIVIMKMRERLVTVRRALKR